MTTNGQPNPWRYLGLGTELAGTVGGMCLLGYGLDRWQGTAPWGLVGGAIFGIVVGMYQIIRKALLFSRQDERKRNRSQS